MLARTKKFSPSVLGFAGFCVAVCGSAGDGKAETLSGFTRKSDQQLTPEGRLVVGRPANYKPSTEDEKLLSAKLKNSMLERRKFAWTIFDQMLYQTRVKLPEGDAEVSVPTWQTWYEGSSRALQ